MEKERIKFIKISSFTHYFFFFVWICFTLLFFKFRLSFVFFALVVSLTLQLKGSATNYTNDAWNITAVHRKKNEGEGTQLENNVRLTILSFSANRNIIFRIILRPKKKIIRLIYSDYDEETEKVSCSRSNRNKWPERNYVFFYMF